MESSDYEQIAAADYLSGLVERPVDDVRAMRRQCQSLEVAVSYGRRMLQGQLDIVRGEHQRRRRGERPSTMVELVSNLSQTMTIGGPPAHTVTRQSVSMNGVPLLNDELKRVLESSAPDRLPELNDSELDAVLADLETTERDVSSVRQVLFERLDHLSDELTRRYRVGETSVDELLR